jgi:ligand-binding sensor domain-containing protein/two-component sensor histidine kinase
VGANQGFLVCRPGPVSCSEERFWSSGQGLLADYVMDVSSAVGGGAWVLGLDGISRIPLSASSDKVRTFLARADVGDFPLEAIAEDREGNVWVGSDGGGASRITTDGLVSYSEREGLGSHDVISMFEDTRGQLFAVSRSGNGLFLNRLVGEKFQAIRLNIDPRRVSPIWHGHYQVIAAGAEGEWWVATHLGLARFSRIREASELSRASPRYELAGDNLFRLFRDRQGNVWISPQHGPDRVLMRWNCRRQVVEWFQVSAGNPSLANDRVQAYTEDRAGQVWMGLEHGGLWHACPIGFCRYDLPKEMLESTINWLHTDTAGRIWIAAGAAGAARIDELADQNHKLVRYTTMEGLASNEILCITEDLSGKIYLGTARGVDRLDPETGRVKHFTTADGLAFGELQTAFRDRRGWLWFGTQQGLSRLIPGPSAAGDAPPVAITALSTGGVSAPISPSGETEVSLPDLPTGRDQVQVEFVGLGFRAGEVLRYQYSLLGAANQWSDLTMQRTVTYAGLRPGRYRFLVRAVNSDGLMTPHPASVQFTILPPIWMHWWFVSIALTALGLAIWSTWRYRQKHLTAVRGIRTRITADLHDDIGSSLSQIAILSELARQETANGTQDRTARLDHIADLSRELVDSMSDIVWATDPGHDRLGDLAQHMREFAGEVLGGSNIEFRFVTAGIEPDLKLDANVRRQSFLVFKESIHNLIRHSRCCKAEATLERDGSWLSLKVSDNGIGFDASRDFEGHGFASMRERARTLSGEIECISDAGGTTVRLRVPLRP